jgi:hypothetical protein
VNTPPRLPRLFHRQIRAVRKIHFLSILFREATPALERQKRFHTEARERTGRPRAWPRGAWPWHPFRRAFARAPSPFLHSLGAAAPVPPTRGAEAVSGLLLFPPPRRPSAVAEITRRSRTSRLRLRRVISMRIRSRASRRCR